MRNYLPFETDETVVSTPVPVMRDSDTPAVANHFPYRSRRSIRHQSVTPVRSSRPMINGYDDAHEHTEVNTHTMNDSERDRDDDLDDDMSAYERDPNDHRRWRRTRVATIESTNIQCSNLSTESSSDRSTSCSIRISNSTNNNADDSDYENMPALYDSDADSDDDDDDENDDDDDENDDDDGENDNDDDSENDDDDDLDDSDIDDNSDDDGRPFRRITLISSRTNILPRRPTSQCVSSSTTANGPVPSRTRSASVFRNKLRLADLIHNEVIAKLEAGVFTPLPHLMTHSNLDQPHLLPVTLTRPFLLSMLP